MTEAGFVMGQSDNLPRIDAFMMTNFFVNHPDFTSAEIRGVKDARSERDSYGDSAIGYVQVKRETSICIVKALITPEHNVKKKSYSVKVLCDEAEEKIISAQCEDCAAHLGGCKHAIAFIAWLHRRSEDLPPTSVECYWKKSKLSSIGTTLKFIKSNELWSTSKQNQLSTTTDNQGFLTALISRSRMNNNMNCQLMKFFKEKDSVEKLSIHYLLDKMPKKPDDATEFIHFCRSLMDILTCKEARRATVQQSNCPLWYELRYARITASKMHEAAHCKVLEGTLNEVIMGASKIKDTDAMKRGRLLEKLVLKEVEKKMKIKINECGLILNPDYPIFGASPDGESTEYSIEIKCPLSEKAMSRYITRDNKISTKHMGQVQMQMFFSKKQKGLFCVAHHDFEISKEVDIFSVDYDEEFCKNLLEQSTLFWSRAIFPILKKAYQ